VSFLRAVGSSPGRLCNSLHREHRSSADRTQVFIGQGHHGHSTPFPSRELHFVTTRFVYADDRSNVASEEPMFGELPSEDDHIVFLVQF